ncbi:Ankyrin repeat-containing domain protein [Ilyonectria robusta]
MVAPGPNISLRAYSVVPRDSPIFKCVKTGDVDKMLDLFRHGAASPLDVDQYGFGLFHVTPRFRLSDSRLILAQHACFHGNLTVMKFLRQLDIRCLEVSKRYSCILTYLLRISREDSVTEAGYHFLQENGAFHKENSDSDEQWSLYLSNSRILCSTFPNALRLVLPHISPDHYTSSTCERLTSVHLYGSHPISLRLFLQPDGIIVANDVRELQQEAISLAVLVALLSTAQTRKQTPPTNDWRRFRRDTIAVTESLSFQQGPLGSILERYSPLSHQPIGTAFSAVIVGTMLSIYRWDGYEAKNDWIYQLNTALRTWLEDLSIAGVDLTEYGRIEKAILSSTSALDKSSSTLCGSVVQIPSDWLGAKRWYYYQIGHIKLENFTYGPKPTDWSYVWDYPTENFSGEFWEMIDNMALKIPGSWVEDSDSDESSSFDSDEWAIYG